MPIHDIEDSDIRRIDLNLLPVLAMLLEERSVTRAARRLHLTQSTVSGMLARLREALGDALLTRSRHGLVPTPRAEALAGPLRAWLAASQELIAPAAFDPARWSGSVALGGTDYTQQVLFEPLVRVLRERAPALRVALVALRFEEIAERLARGGLDLVVSAAAWVPPSLPALALWTERYVLAMWSGHPLARRRRVSLDDFCRYDHILVSPSGGAFVGPVDEELSRLGRRRSVRLSVPSFARVPDLLVGSELLCVTPERMVGGRDDVCTGTTPFDIPPVEMTAVWHPRVADDAAHRWLRETIAETARRIGAVRRRAGRR